LYEILSDVIQAGVVKSRDILENGRGFGTQRVDSGQKDNFI